MGDQDGVERAIKIAWRTQLEFNFRATLDEKHYQVRRERSGTGSAGNAESAPVWNGRIGQQMLGGSRAN